jgi:ABC-type glycerol-3-phosphate transport system permease component
MTSTESLSAPVKFWTVCWFGLTTYLSFFAGLLLFSLTHRRLDILEVMGSWPGWLWLAIILASMALETVAVKGVLMDNERKDDEFIGVASPPWVYNGLVNHIVTSGNALWVDALGAFVLAGTTFFVRDFGFLRYKIGAFISLALVTVPFLLWFTAWARDFDPSDYVLVRRHCGIKEQYGKLFSLYYSWTGAVFLVLSTLFYLLIIILDHYQASILHNYQVGGLLALAGTTVWNPTEMK